MSPIPHAVWAPWKAPTSPVRRLSYRSKEPRAPADADRRMRDPPGLLLLCVCVCGGVCCVCGGGGNRSPPGLGQLPTFRRREFGSTLQVGAARGLAPVEEDNGEVRKSSGWEGPCCSGEGLGTVVVCGDAGLLQFGEGAPRFPEPGACELLGGRKMAPLAAPGRCEWLPLRTSCAGVLRSPAPLVTEPKPSNMSSCASTASAQAREAPIGPRAGLGTL